MDEPSASPTRYPTFFPTVSNRVVSTQAGSLNGFQDGIGTVARFKQPRDVCLSLDDSYMLIPDGNNHAIRKYIMLTDEVFTVAGDGEFGFVDVTHNHLLLFINLMVD